MKFSRQAAAAKDNRWFGEYHENRHTKMVQLIVYGNTLQSTAFGDGENVSVKLEKWGPDLWHYDIEMHDFAITATLPDGRKYGKTFEVKYMRGMLNGVAWPDRFLDVEIQKCITDVRKSEVPNQWKPLIIDALEAWLK